MADLTTELADVLGGQVHVLEDNADHIAVTWDDGSYVHMVKSPGNVHFGHLEAKRDGLLTDLVSKLPAVFRKRKVKTFTTSVSTPESVAWIEAVGFQPDGDVYSVSIAKGGRFDEYAAWKSGDADEPGWHRGDQA